MTAINRLNTPYPMTAASMDESTHTKERILVSATILFAENGVDSVSMKDIAREVDITAASIYNHFESKEVLFEAVLERIKTLYMLYFKRLGEAIDQASSFKEVLDYMFAELFKVVDIFNYYGITLVQTEQFHDLKAYEVYKDIYFKYSIDFISSKFDGCIKAGWARQFDTRSIAAIFMNNVLATNNLRIHENLGREIPYKIDDMHQATYDFIYSMGR